MCLICLEQCLLLFLVRQHVLQELALSASAAGPSHATLGVTFAYTVTLGFGWAVRH